VQGYKKLIKTYKKKKTTSNSYRGKTKVIEKEEENESIEDPYWIHPLQMNNWKNNIFEEKVMNRTKELLLVLDGNLILQNGIIDYKDLTMDYILLLYLPHLLEQTIYDTTLVLTNVYYEHCPYHGKSGKDEIQGDCLSVSHGYRWHGGQRICGNVGLYHLDLEFKTKEHAWRNMEDVIANNI
jgi:hypothetical protein